MKHPSVEQLHSGAGFELLLTMDFQDMIPFVFTQIRRRGLMSLLYILVNLLMAACILFFLIRGLFSGMLTGKIILMQLVSGFLAGSILVIPVHELIHGLAYRILGARKIHFGADLRQFIFFVTADRHPVSGIQIIFLALLPFALINLMVIAITFILLPPYTLFGASFLLFHNLMCIGDFAISNFVKLHQMRKVYSYDVVKERKSYFFGEK
jgi:hypothetical protein